MKMLLILSLCLSFTASAQVDLVSKMVGKYVAADEACAYTTATIKKSRMGENSVLNITLSNSRIGAFNNQMIDLDNLWTKVRTTRGFQRIVKQDRIQGTTIMTEEKKCLPGWVGCNDWQVKASVTLLNDDTIEAQLSPEEATCVFKRTK